MDASSSRDFTRRWLPWLAGGLMLAVYVFTLNREISVRSLDALVRLAGWSWQPTYVAPVTFLAGYPIRWLPPAWQLPGANLLFAVCGALALGLLARSVAILPHDRTREQRAREGSEHGLLTMPLAWLPPLLAVLACGLQLTFWEHAVVCTSETLDLLMFAYVVRCLLEYRLDRRDRWLYQLALVYGVAITNNFAMIAFFPAMLAVLLWIRGRAFFQVKFLLRMTLLGGAGLSLYLLLPILVDASTTNDVGFMGAMKTQLATQKSNLRLLPLTPTLLLAAASFLPLLLIGIRWPSTFGDASTVGVWFATMLTHLLFAGALALSALICLDWLVISPRLTGFGLAFLPLYYLSALALGYFTGYFLLVFWPRRSASARRREAGGLKILRLVISTVVCAGAVALPGALVWRNYPLIVEQNSSDLVRFTRQLVDSFMKASPDGAVLLSDDPVRLYAVEAMLSKEQRRKYVLLNTEFMPDRLYHRYLHQRYPGQIPPIASTDNAPTFTQGSLIQMMQRIAGQQHRVFYLHPSFGYYFERFYAHPHGVACELLVFPTNALAAPLPTAAEFATQEAWWQAAESAHVADLRQRLARTRPDAGRSVGTNLRMVGSYYSQSLDFLGVLLQRAGQPADAQRTYENAITLNDQNASAYVNLEFSRFWEKEHKTLPMYSQESASRLSLYLSGGRWERLLALCGPLEEPILCSQLSDVFTGAGLLRQSVQETLRYLVYFPTNVLAQVGLVQRILMAGLPDQALERITWLRGQKMPLTIEQELNLISLEAWAYYFKEDVAKAEAILADAQRKFPARDEAYASLMRIYATQAETLNRVGSVEESHVAYTNAIRLLERQVGLQPGNADAWAGLGALWLQLRDFSRAVKALDQSLARNPRQDVALFNRAYVHLQLERWAEARRDYLELIRLGVDRPAVYFGLGECAWNQKDWEQAKKGYATFLEQSFPGTPEATHARRRLAELQLKQFN